MALPTLIIPPARSKMHSPGTRLTATVTKLRDNAVELLAEDGSRLLMLGPQATPEGTQLVLDCFNLGQVVVVAVLHFSTSENVYMVTRRLPCRPTPDSPPQARSG